MSAFFNPRFIPRRLPIVILAFVVAACASASNSSQQVEAYLKARAAGNANQMVSLSCAAWEPQARIEASSFKALNARVEGLTCQSTGTEGQASFVGCAGKIITSYNGESREVNLADRQFKTLHESGEWRVCGYR